ncbi:hypothetical protein, partial [Pseudonocardia sp. N23]|uniref:hypothetical protein n=1 Tax=Pseudonocardia sp. N23 TaxID=1987376 RepID=UPI001C0EDB73
PAAADPTAVDPAAADPTTVDLTATPAGTPRLADSVRADVESLLDDLPLQTRPRVAVLVRTLGGPR